MSYIIRKINPEDISEKKKLSNILNELKDKDFINIELVLSKFDENGFVICKLIKI